MKINKDTELYLSFSKAPGNLGAKTYNHFFNELGINAVYLPRVASSPKQVIEAIKTLRVKGASISTPLKQGIIPYLDEIDSTALVIGSVNTVVNRDGKLIGHNSDAIGFYELIKPINFKTVCILGSGGVVPSLIWALKQKGISSSDIHLSARNEEASQTLTELHDLRKEPYTHFDLLINATPTGDLPTDKVITLISMTRYLIDLNVVGIPVLLQEFAQKFKINSLPGSELFIRQFQKQFEIYFGKKLELEAINSILKS